VNEGMVGEIWETLSFIRWFMERTSNFSFKIAREAFREKMFDVVDHIYARFTVPPNKTVTLMFNCPEHMDRWLSIVEKHNQPIVWSYFDPHLRTVDIALARTILRHGFPKQKLWKCLYLSCRDTEEGWLAFLEEENYDFCDPEGLTMIWKYAIHLTNRYNNTLAFLMKRNIPVPATATEIFEHVIDSKMNEHDVAFVELVKRFINHVPRETKIQCFANVCLHGSVSMLEAFLLHFQQNEKEFVVTNQMFEFACRHGNADKVEKLLAFMSLHLHDDTAVLEAGYAIAKYLRHKKLSRYLNRRIKSLT